MSSTTLKATARNFIPRNIIHPDPNQPRKVFDEAKLAELRISFGPEPGGIHTDLLVRAHPKKDGEFMITAGERRWRAANLEIKYDGLDLKPLTELPCRILTAEEAAEATKLQLTENMQRENMTALEEAAGMQRELETRQKADAKFSKADLGHVLGLSRATVYERLALLNLTGPVHAALVKGKITTSHATRIAVVPTETGQKELLESMEQSTRWGGDGMSVRQLEERIESTQCKSLKGAPFKLDEVLRGKTAKDETDLELVACKDCPYRSGNMPNYPDKKNTNLCLRPACYRAKALVTAAANGHQTLSAKEYEAHQNEYVDPEEWASYGSKGHCRAKEAVGKRGPQTVAAIDRRGDVKFVWPKAEFKAACIKNGVTFEKPKKKDNAKEREEEAKQEFENAVRESASTTALVAAVEKIEKDAGNDKNELAFWRYLFATSSFEHDLDGWEECLKRRGLKGSALATATKDFKTAGQFRGLLFESVVRNYNGDLSDIDGYEGNFEEGCKHFGIDLKKFEKAARVELAKQDPAERVDADAVKWLTGCSAGDINFKSHLAKANAATCREALKSKSGVTPTALKLIEGRLKTATKEEGKKK